MSFFSLLGSFFIGPLKLLFEVIFQVANGFVSNPGFAIIFLSLAMNLLVLPLYRRADAMQERARDIEARLHDGVAHIKKTFSGNERFMMLQTYYRQNDYSPTNALRGSVSLLLEIPFFMAAYQFLSGLELLKGVSFGPIADLGAPDALIAVGGFTVNLLPVLMTTINIISSVIYLKGFPLKTKIQLYALALFFLVFLYTSPSGLVFYWTLNNVFSLGKNICYRIFKPKEKVRERKAGEVRTNRRLFVTAALLLTVLTGLLIPSTYIGASPEEFVDVTHFFHPGWFIANAAALAAGTFLLWFGVFYWLASPRGKVFFERILCAFGIVALIDYTFFGRFLGNVSHTLQYDTGLNYVPLEIWINVGVVLLFGAGMVLAASKWPKKVTVVFTAVTVAMTGLTLYNVAQMAGYISDIWQDDPGDEPHFTLSRTENNVVFIFLDRGMGEYLPYLMKERPDLKDSFDGFTYYSNVISFGGHTNFGAPALMGGYEYTPVEINKRDSELLVDKHNESLKVLPVLFLKNGYDVTVMDAPYANYKWIPDLSIYDDYPEISKYITIGYFGSTDAKEQTIQNNKRNFFCFSLMKILPVPLQAAAYDSGNYHRAGDLTEEAASTQITSGASVADGMQASFMESYEALINMKTMTKIEEGAKKSFLFFYNDLPHEPMLLQEPEYVPAAHVDNTAFDEENTDRFTADGKSITVSSLRQRMHYETSMATMLALADWLDYLKEEGVYDNTKIIIGSDHGYYLYQSEVFQFPEYEFSNGYHLDISNYFPLLMVKDFGASGFTTSDEFMTNADVPTIACEGSIDDPVNPFTGKAINSSEKTAHDQFIISYHAGWDTTYNNGKTFFACPWAVVTDNIWDRDDWQFIEDDVVLKEHKIPQKEQK